MNAPKEAYKGNMVISALVKLLEVSGTSENRYIHPVVGYTVVQWLALRNDNTVHMPTYVLT